MGKLIPFRLRDGKDDDIAEALEAASQETDRSDVIRAALRCYLFGKQRPPLLMDKGPVDLKKKEKDADQLEGDLDTLLGNF
ncbi:hypothetical protein HWB91_gp18 [Bacillus phage vB_BboS-125]|uniref:Uncharacterized protein n=1 Tax=Bacillus phage vB_BboS-125 TaxID=2419618 RepID=A0A3G3BVV9_9CAUD|nr:hypothetical protein HWB91_gp18 [Bacillus phage vB_BboS-125]AYP68388.1 hypothetical protein BboS125_00018 [Bacillus phage vB_BboS-125]